MAVIGGHKEIAEILISKGANVNTESMDSQTPLHLAVRKGDKDLVELFLTKGAYVNARNWGGQPLYNIISCCQAGKTITNQVAIITT